jgi:hypothetical protein
MEGLWLISYITLWVFVILQSLFIIALIRHIGNLRIWLKQSGLIVDIEELEEGVPIGEAVPELREALELKVEPPIVTDRLKPLLLFMVAPVLPGCDDLIPAIGDLDNRLKDYETVFVSMEPAVDKQFEFIKHSGIEAPIVLKNGWELTKLCRIRSAPYALIFDQENVLRSKAPVGDKDTLEQLITKHRSNSY